jgi:hypothetical protein
MKSLDQINKLVAKFEAKLSLAQDVQVQQQGTTELFFGDESKQMAFNAKIQDGKGAVAKVLFDYYSKSGGKPCSFSLSASANPNVGAKWSLTTSPASLATPLAKALDAALRTITGKGMADTQKFADAAAKKGGGSGELQIGSLDAS